VSINVQLLKDRIRKSRRAFRVQSYRTALKQRVLAATEHESVLGGLSIDAVVDVGANRGQFSLVAARVFADVPIVAFEPLPGPAALYRSVLGSRSVLHECAVGSKEGDGDIFETADEDSSSLLEPLEAQTRLSAGSVVARRRNVRMVTIDEELSDFKACRALLKIDVQGYELEVLRGAKSFLQERTAFVYVEASLRELYRGQPLFPEVVEFLGNCGFVCVRIENPTMDGTEVVQADMLFARHP
jgi:FkbM family methyltransferase